MLPLGFPSGLASKHSPIVPGNRMGRPFELPHPGCHKHTTERESDEVPESLSTAKLPEVSGGGSEGLPRPDSSPTVALA
jgi:hypothetical protein